LWKESIFIADLFLLCHELSTALYWFKRRMQPKTATILTVAHWGTSEGAPSEFAEFETVIG